ncbi:meiosis initiator protein isoform X2 [Engystomops pustulosus]
MMELAGALPGGQRVQCGDKRLLLCVISYIQFLQQRIQEAQIRLLPHSSRQGLLPLWTPRRSAVVGSRNGCACPRLRGRWKPSGPEAKTNIRRQMLVPYVSSSSSDNGDGGPWLPVSVSPHSPHGPCTPKSSSAAPLELSPLLFSSPDDQPPVLFEEVEMESCSWEDFQGSAVAFSLDHSYQLSGQSSNICPLQATMERTAVAKAHKTYQPPVGGTEGSGPRRCIQVHSTKRRPQARASRDDVNTANSDQSATLTQRPRTFSRLQQLRKKCVNGFIMFCRLNRRPYLSAHPGKASTTATKDLAELWRVMSPRERRPYCMKALQFSLLHDRLVKRGSLGLPQENTSPPKPVSLLLAEKAAAHGNQWAHNLSPEISDSSCH